MDRCVELLGYCLLIRSHQALHLVHHASTELDSGLLLFCVVNFDMIEQSLFAHPQGQPSVFCSPLVPTVDQSFSFGLTSGQAI